MLLSIVLASVTCAADLARCCARAKEELPFVVTAKVVSVMSYSIPKDLRAVNVEDTTGFAALRLVNDGLKTAVAAGDVAVFSGRTDNHGVRLGTALAASVRILRHEEPSPVRDFSFAQVLDDRFNFACGRLSGVVVEAFVDELDDRFAYFVLKDGPESVIMTCPIAPRQKDRLPALIGAKIRVWGEVVPRFPAWRELLGRGFEMRSNHHERGIDLIEVLEPAPDDPFEVTGRKRFFGQVIAVWQGAHALVASGTWNRLHRIDFAQGQPLPAYGDNVEVAGEPVTDSYCENLIRAIWRKSEKKVYSQRPSGDANPADILRKDAHGVRVFDPLYHGKLVRMTGRVIGRPSDRHVVYLQCADETVPVDMSASQDGLSALREGATVAVTGTVVLDVPNWRRGEPFPHITGFTLVPRRPSDVEVLVPPPWWTPTRILLLAALAVLVLAGFGLRERIRKRLAQMRVSERTKLAIELHDSVTQTLSAAGLQLDAAIRVAEKSGYQPVVGVLRTAAQTLSSGLMELRNCLWDLRNRALDLPDFAAAIRRTVEPHLKGAALHVRFAVPRRDLADDVAHAVLQMIRELVSNAVRHGQAKTIRIAGAVYADGASRRLLFSVANDGAGFDLDAVPGVGAGHFGLQGLRERVRRFGGRLKIESQPSVKVSVELPMEGGSG